MHHNKYTKIVEYFKPLNKKWFPLEWFPEDVFFPLQKYQFGPLMVYGPNDSHWYLNHYYGASYMDEAVIYPKHFQPKFYGKITKDVKGIFTKPALPKKLLMDRVSYLKLQIEKDLKK